MVMETPLPPSISGRASAPEIRTTSVTFAILLGAISEICTKPSRLPIKLTNAPKSTTFTTVPE